MNRLCREFTKSIYIYFCKHNKSLMNEVFTAPAEISLPRKQKKISKKKSSSWKSGFKNIEHSSKEKNSALRSFSLKISTQSSLHREVINS